MGERDQGPNWAEEEPGIECLRCRERGCPPGTGIQRLTANMVRNCFSPWKSKVLRKWDAVMGKTNLRREWLSAQSRTRRALNGVPQSMAWTTRRQHGGPGWGDEELSPHQEEWSGRKVQASRSDWHKQLLNPWQRIPFCKLLQNSKEIKESLEFSTIKMLIKETLIK